MLEYHGLLFGIKLVKVNHIYRGQLSEVGCIAALVKVPTTTSNGLQGRSPFGFGFFDFFDFLYLCKVDLVLGPTRMASIDSM